MVKFIHTGDLHLGLKFKNISFHPDKAVERRRELWSTFEKIVDYAVNSEVEFLLIAGDLFEESYFTIGDIKRIRDTFRNAKNINVIISAGNHDYKGRNSLYDKIEWTENVTIFNSKGVEKQEFPKSNTCIYGYSWDTMEIRDHNIFNSIKDSVDEGRNNILVLHGDIGANSRYLPLNVDELKELKMDYIALGHIHKPEILSDNIAYCGSPEPLDFGETGERGIIEGNIINKNLEFKFIPFSKRSFHQIDMKINENMGYPDIIRKIKNIQVGNKNVDFYRINLKGFIERNVSLVDLEKDLEEGFYHIEIKDDTTIDYDLEILENENQNNIIGEFIKEMKEEGLDKPIVKEALYIGLEVLLRGKV